MYEKRLVYLDVLRIAAVVGIITIHVSGNNFHTIDVNSFSWQVFNAFDSCSRWSVPVFVMISGTLFLNPKSARGQDIKRLYTKSIFRIAIVLVVTSVAYVVFDALVLGVTYSDKWDVLNRLICGEFHLWYLYMLIGLYAITPLLRRITADAALTRYFLLLSIVLTFFVPTLFEIMRTIDPIVHKSVISHLYPILTSASSKFNYYFTLGYVAFYVLGYYLSVTPLSKKARIALYVSALLSFAFTIGYSSYISTASGEAYGFYGNMMLTTLIQACAIFVFVKTLVQTGKSSVEELSEDPNDNKSNRWLLPKVVAVSEATFGVYLIHIMVYESIKHFCGLNTMTGNPIASVCLLVVATFVISLVITLLLRKVPFVRRFV